jgi:hypothetical protein
MHTRPTLLNSCAKAATAVEARFRIDAPDPTPQATRIVALDEGAAALIRGVAKRHWRSAHFLTYEPGTPVPDGDGGSPDLILRAADGSQVRLSAELAGADMSVMVATADVGAHAASVIGEACARRGIMTTGLAFGDDRDVAAAVSALRPHARVLLVSKDTDDVPEVLAALRA